MRRTANIKSSSSLELILHIGPHKTGTTSLQRALLNAYGADEPQPIWYPRPLHGGPGHTTISKNLMKDSKPLLSQAIKQASDRGSHTLIISAEGLAWAPYRNRLPNLLQQTSKVRVHIVSTLSPICQRAVSLWQQGIKRHLWVTALSGSLENVLGEPGLQADLIPQFASALPEAKLSVLITGKTAPHVIYDRFSQATGVSLARSNPGRRLENVSLGLAEVEILRAFGVVAEGAGFTDKLRRQGRQMLRQLMLSEPWRATIPKVPLRLPQEWLPSLANRTAEILKVLRTLESENRIQVFGDLDSLDDRKLAIRHSDHRDESTARQ